MTTVKFKGNPVTLKGDLPKEGETAPDFTGVKDDLSEIKFSDIKSKIRIILSVHSLDTSTCAAEILQFSQKLAQKPGTQALVVSEDLPFAMKRYLQANKIENIIPVSDYRYRDFSSKYNTEMIDGPLKGLSVRAVFIVGADNKIKYVELTPEISLEPEYNKALAVVDSLM